MRALVASIIALQLAGGVARGDAVEDAAQVHLDRGIAAFRDGDFALARHELTAASELVPDKPNPYRWLALTEVQLGDCPHALLDIDSFLARVPPNDARRPELVRLRDLCQHQGVPKVTTDPAPPAGPAVTAQHDPPPRHTSITHRWWFWTAVVGVAATVTGVVLYATRDDGGPAVLPPVVCDPSGCHPGAP